MGLNSSRVMLGLWSLFKTIYSVILTDTLSNIGWRNFFFTAHFNFLKEFLNRKEFYVILLLLGFFFQVYIFFFNLYLKMASGGMDNPVPNVRHLLCLFTNVLCNSSNGHLEIDRFSMSSKTRVWWFCLRL